MSPLSRESKLAHLRQTLCELNDQFIELIVQRRDLSLKIQELKTQTSRYSHFDPLREKEVFLQMQMTIQGLGLKELLAFSLVMEDQAMAMAPGSYPSWSTGAHLIGQSKRELYTMLNPLLLKMTHPALFNSLELNEEFSFLKDL